jgi:hypothetical protein
LAKVSLNAWSNPTPHQIAPRPVTGEAVEPGSSKAIAFEILEHTTKILSIMTDHFQCNRNIYVPGETRDCDKIRETFILSGGLLILLCLNCFCMNEKIRELPINASFSSLDLNDWQIQSTIIANMISRTKGGEI